MPRAKLGDVPTPQEFKLICDWLRNLRQQNGLTQTAMARRVGASKNYYHAVESGTKVPSGRLLRRIALVFDDVDGLQAITPHLTTSMDDVRLPESGASGGELTASATLGSLFDALQLDRPQQRLSITESGPELLYWGIPEGTMVLTERVADPIELRDGSLVQYRMGESERWGFVSLDRGKCTMVSPGYSVMEWLEAPLSEVDSLGVDVEILRQDVDPASDDVVLRVARMMIGPAPTAESPLVSHPQLQRMPVSDLDLSFRLLTRFARK